MSECTITDDSTINGYPMPEGMDTGFIGVAYTEIDDASGREHRTRLVYQTAREAMREGMDLSVELHGIGFGARRVTRAASTPWGRQRKTDIEDDQK